MYLVLVFFFTFLQENYAVVEQRVKEIKIEATGE